MAEISKLKGTKTQYFPKLKENILKTQRKFVLKLSFSETFRGEPKIEPCRDYIPGRFYPIFESFNNFSNETFKVIKKLNKIHQNLGKIWPKLKDFLAKTQIFYQNSTFRKVHSPTLPPKRPKNKPGLGT